MEPTRRDILKIGGLGVVGVATAASLNWVAHAKDTVSELRAQNTPRPFVFDFAQPPVLKPRGSTRDPDGVWVDHYSVTEREGVAHILPGGLATRVWGYDGISPGPTIKVRQGRRTLLRVRNHLPSRHPTLGFDFYTSVHLHGSPSLPQYDGYASDITEPGFYKDYRFPGFEPGRTLWYHDHGVHHTAMSAFTGLAAQFHVHDPEEVRLLPQGDFDVPVTVRDALFSADGSLAYDDNSQSGLFGDVLLVNGVPWPAMRVKRRIYRFRFLNASVTRSYRFQLGGGDPMTVVATDDGLMPRAQTVKTWRHGVAERYEVLIDFRRYRAGERVVLRNLSNEHNVDYQNTDQVMAFDVTDEPFDKSDPTWNRIPGELVDVEVMNRTESSAVRTRQMEFSRQHGHWTINGLTWQDVIDSGFQKVVADPNLGDVEIWEIVNKSGGWFHPVHIHLVDFRILDRNGRPPFAYELGAKDVVYLGENERVRVLMKFGPEVGRYMIHCHNLVHEDHDMMNQFAVGWKPGQPDPNDPILAAPPRKDDLPPDPATS